jgi:hypothetical protein
VTTGPRCITGIHLRIPKDALCTGHKLRAFGHDNLVKRRYKPTLEIDGISCINWHSLIHYADPNWIEAGLAVQIFAGHSILSAELDRYKRLFPTNDYKASMDAIAGELMGWVCLG